MKLERFGGLNTLIDPTNLPVYASPDCQDVEFLPGLVRTRPGFTSVFTALGGNPTVNYLKTYVTPAGAIRTLVFDSTVALYKEQPQGTLVTISNGFTFIPAARVNSVSLFGREYLAYSDGQFGTNHPFQYDDTNLDLVSQEGVGSAPTAVDETVVFTITAGPNGATQPAAVTIAAGPTGAVENGVIVTITTTTPHGLLVGDSTVIAGVGVAGYNGTFKVLSVPSITTFTYELGVSGLASSGGGTSSSTVATFQITASTTQMSVKETLAVAGVGIAGYNGTWVVRSIVDVTHFTAILNVSGLAASGGGTATPVGNIVAGVHQVSMMFLTRNGYITKPAPPTKWTSSGGKRVIVSNYPSVPNDGTIAAMIFIFTAAGGSSFFYTSSDLPIFGGNMIFSQAVGGGFNNGQPIIIDFSDVSLLAGTNADAFFNLIELGECSGVTQYFSRLFWWGERNIGTIGGARNFLNLTFEGGANGVGGGGTCPAGWTPDVSNFAGGNVSFFGSPFGTGYTITGNGVAAIRGLITQSAFQDYLGNPILSVNVPYSIRVKLIANAGPGALHFELFSASASISTGFTFPFASQPNTIELIAPLTTGLATVPPDLVLRVYADGTPANASPVTVYQIEIFPTNQPYNTTIVRASNAEDPESYDGVTGILQPSPSDGQPVRCCFVLRNNFYIVKDRRIYVTQDDGVNEPNQWTVQEVSQKIGTLSVRGVGLGDEWAIIAGQDGVYYFDGGEPQKISQEIQPTWDSINWSLGYLIDVKVDTKRKRVYIAIPFGSTATANNRLLTLDYTDGFGDPNPTNTVNIAGIGRKWSPWVIACNSMNPILRSDGTQQFWFGNGTGLAAATGKIYQLDTTGTVFADDGAAINSYWQSGYFQDVGRLIFGPLVANIVGVGACNLILRKGDQGWVTNLRSWTLSTLGFHNMERMLNIETERLALRFGTNVAGAHFSLQGAVLYAKAATWAELRGVNY